jgi:ABC-type Fe3+-siderophore transport system permease subunit
LIAAVFIAATMFLGFRVEPRVQGAGVYWYKMHFHVGVTTALLVMLVNAIVLTYFIGTSRWCREVTEAYALPRDAAAASHRLKRLAFPFTLANMLVVVGLAALGAAADTLRQPFGLPWAEWHLLGVLLGLSFMAFASYVQWTQIRANQQVISDIVAQVQGIRAAKGLE